jgi:iron complex transport system ATP-binding protein
MSPLLEAEQLDIRVGQRLLVRQLSLSAQPGALIALLGPNGVGKTLTLHTLAGLRPARHGGVRVRGSDLRLLGQRERALRLGLLLQEQEDPFPTTVLETALVGRHARLGLWQWETAEDHALARDALRVMDLEGMDERLSGTLSGGERRRLGLATLLVQDPDVLLLDEPLNHLDPRHQFALLGTLRRLAGDGQAVIASLHDPVLAARYFDTALLLHGDGRWQMGPVGQLLTAAVLSELYSVPFERYRHEAGDGPSVVLPVPGSDPGADPGNVTPLRRRAPARGTGSEP